MNKRKENNNESLLPDLKHDSMEYSEAVEGADKLDATVKEEAISAEELNALEKDSKDGLDDALHTAERDIIDDEDNFLTEPDEADEFEEDKKDEINI